MGDKYAPRSGGLPTKFNLTKNKLKIVILVSLILLLLIWNSAPFRSTDSPSGRSDAQGSSKNIAELFGGHALQNEDGQRQGGASGKLRASKTKPLKDEENSTEVISERQTLKQKDEELEDSLPEEIPERQTLKQRDEALDDTAPEAISKRRFPKQKDEELEDSLPEEIPEHQALKQSDEALNDTAPEAISERQTLKQKDEELEDNLPEEIPEHQILKQSDEALDDTAIEEISNPETLKQSIEIDYGRDEDGNRLSKANTLRMQIFEEIRSQSLNYTTILTKASRDSSCEGKYIYVYDLPPEFNLDLAAQCDSLFPAFNLCDFFADSGTGKPVVNSKANGSQIFVPQDRWFNTHQYALELVSHAKVNRYKCLTKNIEQAALFYIPFYGGLDVIRWNFARDSTNEKRDALSMKLLRWLENQPAWRRREGRDHVLVLGKISWDFRRQVEGDKWGNRLLEMPETQKMTKVLIERNPWSLNDIGVPHPTFFHPQSASDITTWLHHIQSQNRTSLVTFVGKERPGTTNVRGALVKQCRNATTNPTTNATCRFVECIHNKCQVPAFVTQAFLTSHFCMQPVGDSPTRRSVFDSLIAGCIPVLFHPCTAYVQYPWHLPRNESSWSVYISEDEVKRGEKNVVEVLEKISVEEREAMRETIVRRIVPGLLYSKPGSDVSPYRDAFDITIEQLLHRVSRIERGGRA